MLALPAFQVEHNEPRDFRRLATIIQRQQGHSLPGLNGKYSSQHFRMMFTWWQAGEKILLGAYKRSEIGSPEE